MTMAGDRFELALLLATRAHEGQVRKGTRTPYVSHVLAVCALAIEAGADEDEAIAALLHDAVEDGGGREMLARIDAELGARVAGLVEALSDAFEQPKPPWRERKEAHLDKLARADSSVLLVTCCDKLHNARALLRDYRRVGEPLWERFNGGREGTLWYYERMVEVLEGGAPEALTEELGRTVAELKRLAGRAAG